MPFDLTLAPADSVQVLTKQDAASVVLVPLVAEPSLAGVVSVDFYRLSPTLTLLGTAVRAPWELVCSVQALGNRVIFAIGRDADGVAVECSPPITVSITLPAPPPPPTVTVPNLFGMTPTAAAAALIVAGLVVGAAASSFSPHPAGLVYSQTPLFGVSAARGSAVAIWVSRGMPGVPPVGSPPVDPPPVTPGALVPKPANGVFATFLLGIGWTHPMPLVLPQGWSKGPIQVGNLPTQNDVKCRWPDGTIKLVFLVVKSPALGFYTIKEGPAATGAFIPTWPQAAANFVIGGKTYFANLPAFDPVKPWLTGPHVRETRVVVTPVARGVPHPLLQVMFDVRSYVDGGHRVDVCVQNVKDVTEGTWVNYDLVITINGTVFYSKAGVQHQYLSRGRKVFSVGLVEADVVPDFEPFYLAGALPRFRSSVHPRAINANGSMRADRQKSDFEYLKFGDLEPYMGAPGGRSEIAPYPDWVAQYLVHKKPEHRAFMCLHGDLSGSWSTHITETDGLTPISLDAYPDYWLDGRADARVPGSGPKAMPRTAHLGGPYPGGNDTGYWPFETAHHPSLTYVPYLVTGDRYYLDQMKFWANACLLTTWDGHGLRQRGKGILRDNQVRGIGWALRTLTDTAAFIPDDDPMQAYFRSRLQNNLDHFDNEAKAFNGGPFNVVFLQNGHVSTDLTVSLWHNAYVGWALDHAGKQGFGPVAAMRDRIVKLQVKFFNSEAEGYPRIAGAPYYPTVQQKNAAGQWVWLPTMKAIFDESWKVDPRIQPFPGYYGPEARMMLQIGVREKEPDSQPALDYLMSVSGMAGDLDYRSGWAVMA